MVNQASANPLSKPKKRALLVGIRYRPYHGSGSELLSPWKDIERLRQLLIGEAAYSSRRSNRLPSQRNTDIILMTLLS